MNKKQFKKKTFENVKMASIPLRDLYFVFYKEDLSGQILKEDVYRLRELLLLANNTLSYINSILNKYK